jgi:hypothetical protein
MKARFVAMMVAAFGMGLYIFKMGGLVANWRLAKRLGLPLGEF